MSEGGLHRGLPDSSAISAVPPFLTYSEDIPWSSHLEHAIYPEGMEWKHILHFLMLQLKNENED